MTPPRLPVALTLVAVLAALPGARQSQTPPQQPVFTARIALVPIDVRVLDRNHRPVTDLGPGDFAIFEDGRAQQIQHFSKQTFEPADAPASGPRRSAPEPIGFTPQSQRIFLIMLGRGRLQEPSKGVDALIRFVRQRLLPQDLVAVMAWNRATAFTTDHEQVALVLERFRSRHAGIEHALAMQFGGLGAVYGVGQIPRQIQIDINTVFDVPGASARTLAPTSAADTRRAQDEAQRMAEALKRAEELRNREGAAGAGAVAGVDMAVAELLGGTFDEYIEQNARAMQDLQNLYTGIDYLRRIEGEKHLIYVTEHGAFFPRMETETGLGAFASDARVAIDTIQTGGLPPPNLSKAPTNLTPYFAVRMLRHVSDLTGGQSSIYDYAETATQRLNQATRFQYLLGYYPTNPNWTGQFRKIEVRVTRPNVTVLHRRGYYGRQGPLAMDQREILTNSRLAAALGFNQEIRDIRLQADVRIERVGRTRDAVVEVRIDPSRLAFGRGTNRRSASLDLTVLCFSDAGELIGQAWERFPVTLAEDEYQVMMAKNQVISRTVRIPVDGTVKTVKVVVYDHAADLIGSLVRKLI